jgi:hypothetical protein
MRAGLQAKVKASAAKAHAAYDKREMRTLSGKVPKKVANEFRRICGAHGVTVHAVIAQMAEDSARARAPVCNTDTVARARRRRRQR